MSAPMMIACSTCDGTGKASLLGIRMTCTTCWGAGVEEYTPTCDHLDAMWTGYGLVSDPQWDGANECNRCGALFTLWPVTDADRADADAARAGW